MTCKEAKRTRGFEPMLLQFVVLHHACHDAWGVKSVALSWTKVSFVEVEMEMKGMGLPEDGALCSLSSTRSLCC